MYLPLYVTNSYSWEYATKSVIKMAMLLTMPQKCFRISVPTSALKDCIQNTQVLHFAGASVQPTTVQRKRFITWEPVRKGSTSPFPIAYYGRKLVYFLLTYRGLEMAPAKKKAENSCDPVPVVPQWYLYISECHWSSDRFTEIMTL